MHKLHGTSLCSLKGSACLNEVAVLLARLKVHLLKLALQPAHKHSLIPIITAELD
jgi:hypothetical protein